MACPDGLRKGRLVQLRLARQPWPQERRRNRPGGSDRRRICPGGPIAFTAVIARPEKRSCLPFNATCSTSRLHSSCEPTAREPASSAGCGHGSAFPEAGSSSASGLVLATGSWCTNSSSNYRNAPLADSPCRYRDRMAKSQKKRDIPAGATAVATNRVRAATSTFSTKSSSASCSRAAR